MKRSTRIRVLAGMTVAALAAGPAHAAPAAEAPRTPQAVAAAAVTGSDLGWAQGWRTEHHPRGTADVNGDGRADAVAFGEHGVHIAYGHDDGTLAAASLKLRDFGRAQGWRTDQHPREAADISGDGSADLVGFGNRGLFLSLSGRNGTFGATWGPGTTGAGFGRDQGWRVDRHLRELADLDGDGRLDVVGFGDTGVHASSSAPAGSTTFFAPSTLRVAGFGWNSGWRTDRHVRDLTDVTGDGVLDVVGFGDDGVHVARGRGDGTFTAPALGLRDLGWNQGWRPGPHPRSVVDVNADGRADLVGFGTAGVWVSLSAGDGTFTAPSLQLRNFGQAQGWQDGRHQREVLDLNADGRAEIVAFGDAGTYFSFGGAPEGTFHAPFLGVRDYGWDQGWRKDRHVRRLADVTGDARPDIVGFGERGTVIQPLLTGATFPAE